MVRDVPSGQRVRLQLNPEGNAPPRAGKNMPACGQTTAGEAWPLRPVIGHALGFTVKAPELGSRLPRDELADPHVLSLDIRLQIPGSEILTAQEWVDASWRVPSHHGNGVDVRVREAIVIVEDREHGVLCPPQRLIPGVFVVGLEYNHDLLR